MKIKLLGGGVYKVKGREENLHCWENAFQDYKRKNC